jgi:hypothetical protein
MDLNRPVQLGPPLRGWRRRLARGRHLVLDMVDEIGVEEGVIWLIRLIFERLI